MLISHYHQQYIDQSDEEIQRKADVKELELKAIFTQVSLQTDSVVVKVAVLGCGDKRLIVHHQRLFEKITGKPVELTTFDIATDHLEGAERVIKHDCTLPLPEGPYDITYAHVLLKFIETESQWDLIKNSYYALKPGGLAIHVLDQEDYQTEEPRLKDGLNSVPLLKWEEKLKEEGIKFLEIPVKYGLALVLQFSQ